MADDMMTRVVDRVYGLVAVIFCVVCAAVGLLFLYADLFIWEEDA